MSSFYKPVSTKPDFNSIEQEVIKFWKENDIFQKSLELRDNAAEFVFYEGPPTANGRPGVHHVLTRTFKDLVCRYQTMQGKKVARKAGWDEHGLPVEIEVQKQHNLKSKADIEAMEVGLFNKYCAESTQKYIEEWEQLTERMAYWVDFKNAYRTSDPKYIERVWGILKKLHESKLLYKGHKVVPWACDSGTVVSQAEVALGYKDVIDESAYVKFQLTEASSSALKGKLGIQDNTALYMLAWTTTPWTLPSNMALAVGPEIEYVVCRKKASGGEGLILSEKRWKAVLCEAEWEVVGKLKGLDFFEHANNSSNSDINFKTYTHAVDYEGLLPSDNKNFCRVILGSKSQSNPFQSNISQVVYSIDKSETFVIDDTESGTGIVHIAPAFGQDDFECYKANNIKEDIICAVNQDGSFNDLAPDFIKGQSIFNAAKDNSLEFKRINKIICKHLDEKGLLFKTEKYEHSYPHNWRTGNPLIYFLRPSWYVATSKIKEQLIEANAQVNWYPEHVKEGRFGQWLSNNVDWSISRERYWGTPLPIWENNKGEYKVIGSFDELFKQSKIAPVPLESFDPHKPHIDEITWTDQNGETWKRVPEVLDCWFDSGSMPIASTGVDPENFVSADYICEAVDQTRGWFYTLLAVAVGLQNNKTGEHSPPYKNVLCLGHILDKDGQKMSKSKGNVVNPWELFEKYGADPVRWFMVSAVSAGQPIRFDIAGIAEVMRRFVLPLWNTYAFYVLYANLDEITTDKLEASPGELTERHLKPIDLWIIARLNETQKAVTLEYDSYEFSKATQLIEKLVDDLSNVWVRANRSRFWNTKEASSSVNGGGNVDLGAYQTLHTCLLGICQLAAPLAPMITETIYQNLKSTNSRESIHLGDWVNASTNTDLEQSILNEMAAAQEVINIGRSLRQELGIKIRQPLSQIIISSTLPIKYFADLILTELNIKELIILQQEEKVRLNTELTTELRAEGLARELIHSIQGLRKNSGFEVSDRIELFINFKDAHEVSSLIQSQREYIMKEVLALNWIEESQTIQESKSIKLNGQIIEIGLCKLPEITNK